MANLATDWRPLFERSHRSSEISNHRLSDAQFLQHCLGRAVELRERKQVERRDEEPIKQVVAFRIFTVFFDLATRCGLSFLKAAATLFLSCRSTALSGGRMA